VGYELLVACDLEGDSHRPPPGHPEIPERAVAAMSGIERAGIKEAVEVFKPRKASLEELLAVHSAEYVRLLEDTCRAGGGYLDPDTYVSPGSFDTALLCAGGAIEIVSRMASGSYKAGFLCMRPPGHHALPSRAMGFCLVNNVGLAAKWLEDRGQRVAIIDWDVHHGNGTQDVFYSDHRVMYVSTHQYPFYPGTGHYSEVGEGRGWGTTVNVPLPAGTSGAALRQAFETIVAPVVERFSPDWVLVSAGFDAHRDDPLAMLEATSGDFWHLARVVAQLAPSGRLAFFLEGGYDLQALSLSVGATLAAVLSLPYRPEQPSSAPGTAQPAIERAKRHLEDVGVLVSR
jgi:acetoin utilization deacetylase AcuC-like enzyme